LRSPSTLDDRLSWQRSLEADHYLFLPHEEDEVVALGVLSWAALCRLEVDDKAGGNAGAVGVRAEGVEADVVQLGAESQVGEQADVPAAANAIGKLVGRVATKVTLKQCFERQENAKPGKFNIPTLKNRG